MAGVLPFKVWCRREKRAGQSQIAPPRSSYASTVDMRWGVRLRVTLAIVIVALLLGVVIYYAVNAGRSIP
jgi:hypothetical protein